MQFFIHANIALLENYSPSKFTSLFQIEFYNKYRCQPHFYNKSIYQSYYGREEMKYNRSELCSGRALEFQYNFKAEIGVQIINHIIAERR